MFIILYFACQCFCVHCIVFPIPILLRCIIFCMSMLLHSLYWLSRVNATKIINCHSLSMLLCSFCIPMLLRSLFCLSHTNATTLYYILQVNATTFNVLAFAGQCYYVHSIVFRLPMLLRSLYCLVHLGLVVRFCIIANST